MKLSTHHRLQRRDFVKWIGGAALALPALELFELSAKAQVVAKRANFAVFIYTNDGMHPPAFFPKMGSTDPTSSPTLTPLAPHKSQVTLLGAPVDGTGFPLNNTGLTYNMKPAQHRANICFTASQVVLPIVAGQANATGGPNIVNKGDGPSIDYVIAQYFKQSPLLLGMHPWGGDTPSESTFDESGNPPTRLYQAPQIYSTVFGNVMSGGGGPPTPAQDMTALAKQQAVTNFLNAHFATLRPQLSAYDKAIVDQHLAQLSSYEADVTAKLMAQSNPTTGGTTSCSGPSASGVPAAQQDGSDTLPFSKFIMQTTATVFSCNMNKVVTISFGYPGGGGVGGLRMPWLNYNGASFDDPLHFVSHNGGDPVLSAKYALMNQWIVSQMALLMDLLKAIPTPSGTLLDETAIYLTNRHGNGNGHTNFALPGIIGGGAGGYFKMGQNVVLSQATNPTEVLISMASAMGVPVPQFPMPMFNNKPCASANGPYVAKTELTQIKA
jgi:hypothetical protein